MTYCKRKIFLLDGLGALASLILTGFVLPHYSEEVGLPKGLIQVLALFPLIYSIYSLSCYRFVKNLRPWMILLIAMANFFYALIFAFIILFSDTITIWGRSLMTIELIIISVFIAIEYKFYRKFKNEDA